MSKIGESIYQIECKKYYQELREIHSKIFTSNKRINIEKTHDRYTNGNVDGIENLYTFVNAMVKLFDNKNNINGIDYGCGSHYFVDDINKQYGWNAIGFDSDNSAILDAKRKYPDNARNYNTLDLLKSKMPVSDNSQNFVFCNAVIQHFDNPEFKHCISDISRVLLKDGIFLIIFKRKIEDWNTFSEETGLRVILEDEKNGQIKIEDESMKKSITKLKDKQNNITSDFLTGMRLFHFYSVEEVKEVALQNKLKIMNKIELPNGKITEGVLTYNSGKGIPNAALFFFKT